MSSQLNPERKMKSLKKQKKGKRVFLSRGDEMQKYCVLITISNETFPELPGMRKKVGRPKEALKCLIQETKKPNLYP